MCYVQPEDVVMEDEKDADQPQQITSEAKDATQKSAVRKVIINLLI